MKTPLIAVIWRAMTALLAAATLCSAAPKDFCVRVDISQVPNAQRYVNETEQLITEWYPKTNALLFGEQYPLLLKEVHVIFEPRSYDVVGSDRVEVPAHAKEDVARSIGRIHINYSHLEKMDCGGTLIHELTHISQQCRNPPVWLNEGMGDYVRHKCYDRDIEAKLLPLHGYRFDGKKMDAARFRKEGYIMGYKIAASFLFWLEQRKDAGLIMALNHALRDGRYSPVLFEQRCGSSLNALWSEFIAQTP